MSSEKRRIKLTKKSEKMDRELKPNGRVFEVIKYRTLGYEQHIQHDALDEVGDIYRERKDGWFKNIRNGTGTNILNIENRDEFYEEITNFSEKQKQ